jgi:Ser/Thr protein kinase RdoA (MazF antagonist)
MTQGKENDIYVVEGNFDKCVVRVWGDHTHMGGRLESDINGELDFMQICNLAGIPTPQLHFSKAGNRYEYTPDGRWYAVTSYIEGDCPVSFSAEMAAQIATQMATMHNLVTSFSFPAKRSWPGTVIEMTAKKISALGKPETDDQRRLQQIVEGYLGDLARFDLSVLPVKPIHGDIMRENVKFADGQLTGILDFDDCRESFYLEDIAKSLLFEFESAERCLIGATDKRAARFFEAYESVRTLTPDEQRALPLVLTSRFLYQAVSAWDTPALAVHLDRFSQHQKFFSQND